MSEQKEKASDKRQVVADESDVQEVDGRHVEVNGKSDDRLQHTSDSELSDSDADDDDVSERRKKDESNAANEEDEVQEKSMS